MEKDPIHDFSSRLKAIAKDLSFLGHPRYPLGELRLLFPELKEFISLLDDTGHPFLVNAEEKKREMEHFVKDLSTADLPHQLKNVFSKRIEDYLTLLSMMENFNSPYFYELSIKLYGSSEALIQNQSFLRFLEEIPKFCSPDESERILKGEEALGYLRKKLLEIFEGKDFEVRASSSLLSDASAGRRTLKLNPHKTYTTGELDIFLVHEGWVHLGTALNGQAQPQHSWLSTWAPRTTFLQEGLAIITELITGTMTLERWNKVMLRHLATTMAERGSSITEVYAYLRHHGIEELDAFKLSLRVFRGVPLEGGMAFTKELLYLHGMVELLNHLKELKTDLCSLWAGKMSFAEHLMLHENRNFMNPCVKYFPKGLEELAVKERLRKLQELVPRFP